MVNRRLLPALLMLLVVVGISAQDDPVPDPLATQVFAREMSETLADRAFRVDGLLRFDTVVGRRYDPIIVDTEIDVINEQTRFRQAIGWPGGGLTGGGFFVEIDFYNNPPITPLRLGAGIHNSYSTFRPSNPFGYIMLVVTPVSGLASIMQALSIYGRDDVYEGFSHVGFDLWIGPFTDNFPGYYPEIIRAKPALMDSYRELQDDYEVFGDGSPASEQIFVAYDARVLDYVHTRYWRGTAAFSWQTLIDIFSGLVVADDEFGFPATRLDGGYSEYRWFGDDEFAVFNELSFELDLAAILRSGEAYLEERAAGGGPLSFYALAQRVIERVANEVATEEGATNDITRYGANLERLPFVGSMDLYGYYSQLNGLDPVPAFWEAGLSSSLGPLVLRANGILPQDLPEGAELTDELDYGVGAGLNLGGTGWRLNVAADQVARLGESVYYEASADFENGIGDEGFGLTAGAGVIAPELDPSTREQEARLGLRMRDSSLEVLGFFVENLLLEASLSQAFVDGEETRSVLAFNMTAALW